MSQSNSAGANIGLHRFAVFTTLTTVALIFVGGLVTSTESGLSVPDWPTTYGWNMFTFPYSKWVGGIFYEHSHRLLASFVGFLTIVLTVWTWMKESRKWVRWLAAAALATVIMQGILGGLTVRFLLPTPISTAHACLAQTFFCLIISIALFTSEDWKAGLPTIEEQTGGVRLTTLCVMTTGAIYIQLIVGALMRHMSAGLAIPDFPLAFGRIIPPFTSDKIVVHFAHRIGALIVTAMIVWTFSRIRRAYSDHPILYRPAVVMFVLVLIQLTLGAFTVWTAKSVIPTTAHVATGAMTLGASFFLTVRAFGSVVKRRPALIYPFREPAWK
jgi:cytochrome c oxidase assembly protein subunit 15